MNARGLGGPVLCLTVIGLSGLAGGVAVGAGSGVDSLYWLAGAWGGEEGGLQMEELWLAPKGGSMIAVHRDVAGGKTVSFEFLRIEETQDGLVYLASPKGRPATPFRLVESGEKRAVFENKEHDFPKRILYWLDADSALHARIEGAKGGKALSEEWRWTRQKP